MAIDIDGLAVLGRLAENPSVFSGVKSEANKAARDLVSKQLKSAGLDLQNLIKIFTALGHDNFDLIIEGMPLSTFKSILKKVDKHYAPPKSTTEKELCRHISDLAARTILPAPAPVKIARVSRSPGAQQTVTPAGEDGAKALAPPPSSRRPPRKRS